VSKLIGTSLSNCVKAIAEGTVQYEDVAKITTSTMCATPEDFRSVLDAYKEVYWRRYPAMAETIAKRLIEDGLIDQPRLRNQPTAGPQYELRERGLTPSAWWVPVEYADHMTYNHC
jgi:hypothetical protein